MDRLCVEHLIVAELCDAFLCLRNGLSREHCLVDDARPTKDERVARNASVVLRAHKRANVARHELVRRDLHPVLAAVHKDGVRLRRHLAQLAHVAQTLHDDGRLEHDEHHKRKDAKVPELVEAPEEHAKELEHEKGRGRVLLEELLKGGHRDVERVEAPARNGGLDGHIAREARGGAVVEDRLADGVRNADKVLKRVRRRKRKDKNVPFCRC